MIHDTQLLTQLCPFINLDLCIYLNKIQNNEKVSYELLDILLMTVCDKHSLKGSILKL